MTAVEEKANPWQANFLDDFLFYCCRECDLKHKTKSSFVSHALIQHPLSRAILPTLKSKVSSCDTNVTPVTPVTIKLTKSESDTNDTIETIEVKPELEVIKDEEDAGEPMDFNEPNEYSDYEDDDDESYVPESLDKLINMVESVLSNKNLQPIIVMFANLSLIPLELIVNIEN